MHPQIHQNKPPFLLIFTKTFRFLSLTATATKEVNVFSEKEDNTYLKLAMNKLNLSVFLFLNVHLDYQENNWRSFQQGVLLSHCSDAASACKTVVSLVR